MDYMNEYKKWAESTLLSAAEREELSSIKNDAKEIESRFFSPLKFGTAGLRGVMGVGLNRMNVYIIRQATQGLANLILKEGADAANRGVALSFDCRNNSAEFAREAACVLAANGIKSYIFDSMRPTPELSFAIRHLKCIAGINITASHNPKEYNGYKVYWEDGAQLPPSHASVVADEMSKIDVLSGAKTAPYDKAVEDGLISIIGDKIDDAYVDAVLKMSENRAAIRKAANDFKIVYTPFHGAGYRLVPRVLKEAGFKNIFCVDRQMIPDGSFPTLKSPNPEDKAGFAMSVELAQKCGADLLIATDPDSDRIAIMFKSHGGYDTLSGNQVGALLIDYIIKTRRKNGTLPKNAAVIKTIVTTELSRAICEKNAVACFDTFTGFKFMAELIGRFEKDRSYQYIFAYEESYGYLMGDFARDKDAVTASLMISEMAAYYFGRGMTLLDAMESLYKEYGFYMEDTVNLVMPGVDGLEKMRSLMDSLRASSPKTIAGCSVLKKRDYLTGESVSSSKDDKALLHIKGENVLYFEMEDGTSFIIRPSGTEPKIKVYILARGEERGAVADLVAKYRAAAQDLAK